MSTSSNAAGRQPRAGAPLQPYDVAIVGAGVVGSAIARELARYQLNCALIEAGSDVGVGTSKANTAIYHTGFDAPPGSLESRLLQRSYPLLGAFMTEAGVPYELTGGLLVAWNNEQRQILPDLLEKAAKNGIDDMRLITAEEVYRLEPHLGPGAQAGLTLPGEGILCPFTLTLALATQAVVNGVQLHLNSPVTQITAGEDRFILQAGTTEIQARYLVNAAGLFSDELNRQLGHNEFTVTPRRGELIVFDKFARPLVNHVLLPVPTPITKGVLISPTVFGNVLLGPTAEDLSDKWEKSTTEEGLAYLWQKGAAIMPALMDEEVTATYAGLRAATEHDDYQIYLHADQRYICVGGIRSTGLSGSMGIAEYVVDRLGEAGLRLQPRDLYRPVRMPAIGEQAERPYQSAPLIAGNGAYGKIVCHCERVSLGELNDALRGTIPAQDVDALRRRTRVLQGRCQGFNCHAAVVALLARHTGQDVRRLLQLESDDAG